MKVADSEVKTADTTATTQSSQSSTRKKAAKSEAPRKVSPPREAERGRSLVNWDNPKNDPNKRKSIAEDPEGKGNKLS
jgi:hypothetical protein